MLYQLGYCSISKEKAQIPFSQDDGTADSKQVDAFAIDEETALFIECKSRSEPGPRHLAQEIAQASQIKGRLAQTLRKFFPGKPTPKVAWIICVHNIFVSSEDRNRARAANIHIMESDVLGYYERFLNSIGPAGCYQVLAEFFPNVKIPSIVQHYLPAIQSVHNRYTFYQFVATPRQIFKISFVNHHALATPGGEPAYQRLVNKSRLKKIANYIQNGGSFPTSILLNFHSKPKFEPLDQNHQVAKGIKFGRLYLPKTFKSAWVIDGQHRLFAFSQLSDEFWDHPLFFAAYENLNVYKEAELFITINTEQRSVSRNLTDALMADLKLDDNDPAKRLRALAARICRDLNESRGNAFYEMIAPSDAPAAKHQNLKLTSIMDGLRESGLLGETDSKSLTEGPLYGTSILETRERATVILNAYFNQLAKSAGWRWNDPSGAHVRVNGGIRAHMRLMGQIIKYIGQRYDINPRATSASDLTRKILEVAQPVFDFIEAATEEQIRSNFVTRYGSGGFSEYFYNLCLIVKSKYPDFGPEGLERHERESSQSRRQKAWSTLEDIEVKVREDVIGTLKKLYGTHQVAPDAYAFWEHGIKNQKVKDRVLQRQQRDALEERSQREHYLDLNDLKLIVENKENWEIFRPVYSIPLEGESKRKKYYTRWLGKIAEIKSRIRKYAGKTSVSDEEAELIDFVYSELQNRI